MLDKLGHHQLSRLTPPSAAARFAAGCFPSRFSAACGDSVSLRFGNAAKASDAAGSVGQSEAKIKLLTKDASKHLQFLERQTYPDNPKTSWPIGLMLSLTMDTDVDAYLKAQGISSYDLLNGVNNVLIPKLQTGAPERKISRDDFARLVESVKAFAQAEGVEKVTPAYLWRWLMVDDPSKSINDLLLESGFTEAMVERLRKSPPPVPVQHAPSSQPAKEDILAMRHAATELPKRVIGQEKATTDLVKAFRRAKLGYNLDTKRVNQPKNRTLMLGPSGVGKTYSAEVLAELTGRPLITLELNQFKDKQTLAMLTGAAPGYVGYGDGGSFVDQLIKANEATATQGAPPPIIVLDEIEKANSDVFDVLMQALDTGLIRNGTGQYASLKGCDVLMTSNIAQHEIAEAKRQNWPQEDIEAMVREEMKQHFKLEFIGRIKNMVVFENLTRDDASQILDITLKKFAKALQAEDGVGQLEITGALKAHILDAGFTTEFGARYLDNAVDDILHNALLDFREDLIVNDRPVPQTLVADVKDNTVVIYPKKA